MTLDDFASMHLNADGWREIYDIAGLRWVCNVLRASNVHVIFWEASERRWLLALLPKAWSFLFFSEMVRQDWTSGILPVFCIVAFDLARCVSVFSAEVSYMLRQLPLAEKKTSAKTVATHWWWKRLLQSGHLALHSRRISNRSLRLVHRNLGLVPNPLPPSPLRRLRRLWSHLQQPHIQKLAPLMLPRS